MSETTNTNTKSTGINHWLKKGVAGAASQTPGTPLEVDIDLLDANPDQPRQEMDEEELQDLQESVRQYGLIQPITVTRQPGGRFTIIAGHRRTTVVRRLRDSAPDDATRKRWSTIQATDRGPTATESLAELAITENVQRSDLRPMETAEAIAKLQQTKSLTTEALAQKLNFDLTKTKRYLQLAGAPPAIREALGRGLMVELDDGPTPSGKPKREHRRLEMGHALLVLKVYGHYSRTKPKKAAELTRTLAERVLAEGWPHRKLKDHVDQLLEGRSPQTPEPAQDGAGEGTSPAAAPSAPSLFQDDPKRLVIHRARLADATPDQRASLRAVLADLLAQLK